MKIIQINHLIKKFNSFTALSGVSFDVNQGEIYGLLGPNGAGKSTTMRCLLSLITPTAGSIKLFEKELHSNRREILSKVGYLIEKPDFYGYLSAKRNLSLLAAYAGKKISSARIAEVIEQVGLNGRENDLVKTYSHGMKQRLGLAQVIMHDPELIILDEPNTGLDPLGIIELREFIKQLKHQGKTIILSSHILSEIELIADQMVIINQGQVVLNGSVHDLLHQDDLHVVFELGAVEKAMSIIQTSQWSSHLENKTATTMVFNIKQPEIGVLNHFLNENNVQVTGISYRRKLEELYMSMTQNIK
jgi:ABC-2 type transport system ATP-binding protein